MNIREHIPRMVCEDDVLKQLRKLGFDTDGYKNSLEDILTSQGFGLPKYDEEEERYVFTVEFKYVRAYCNYADALAEEVLLLHELGLLKTN